MLYIIMYVTIMWLYYLHNSCICMYICHCYLFISGSAPITNGIATVTINELECGVVYIIIAGGILNNGTLVGPRSPFRNAHRSCPTVGPPAGNSIYF